MNKQDWMHLRATMRNITEQLGAGRHSTSDDWDDIAEQLVLCVKIARTEAQALAPEYNDGKRMGAR